MMETAGFAVKQRAGVERAFLPNLRAPALLDARMTREADMQMCAFVSSHRLRK